MDKRQINEMTTWRIHETATGYVILDLEQGWHLVIGKSLKSDLEAEKSRIFRSLIVELDKIDSISKLIARLTSP